MSEETSGRWVVSTDLNEIASIASSEHTEKEWETLLCKAEDFESPKFYSAKVLNCAATRVAAVSGHTLFFQPDTIRARPDTSALQCQVVMAESDTTLL